MREMSRVSVLSLALLMLASSAPAAILWNQDMSTGTYKNEWGNVTAGQRFADKAVFGTAVQVNGYSHYTSDATTTHNMTVRVYQDGSSAPGALIASQSVALAGSVLMGNFGGTNVYKWTLNLTALNLAAGTYWFGASHDWNSGGGQVTLNGVASPGDGGMAKYNGATYQYVDNTLGDQAFQVLGAPVPEPTTIALGGLALAAAARRRARRVA